MSSEVTFYNEHVAIIKKGECNVVLVCKKGTVVWVTQPEYTVNKEPFISLLKVCKTTDDAYNKWLYLIGKMCRKDIGSKYFSNPNVDEHCVNGDCVSITWLANILQYTCESWKNIKEGLK